MSAFSDMGKTVSSVFKTTRKAAKAAEHLVVSVDKLQNGTFGMLIDSIEESRAQSKDEAKLNKAKFQAKMAMKKAKFDAKMKTGK